MKQITVCADDYGYTPEISSSIRELISDGCISATSVMTTAYHWQKEAQPLKEIESVCKIGLHFDLIDPEFPLYRWIGLSLFGRIDAEKIKQKLTHQLDLFERQMGRLPDFVDSHQHTHTFPQIREVFLDTLASIFPKKNISIRSLRKLIAPTEAPIKRAILKKISSGFQPSSAHFLTNEAFAGLYSLSPRANFATLFEQWIQKSPTNTLIMVHPGESSNCSYDPIRNTRPMELSYLRSQEYKKVLEDNQVDLC